MHKPVYIMTNMHKKKSYTTKQKAKHTEMCSGMFKVKQ